MGTEILGVDVSTWQHPDGAAIDWEKVYKVGVRFVLVKATQGTSYVNPWFHRDVDDARAAGLLVGAYHYFEAAVPAGAQALNLVKEAVTETLDLGAWLDWECYAPEAYTHSQEMAEFIAGAKEHLGELGVYCDETWSDILAKGSPPITRLWVAAWGSQAPSGALLWQDATNRTCEGIPAPVDTDVLLSTRAVNLPTAPKPKASAEDIAKVVNLVRENTDPASTETV